MFSSIPINDYAGHKTIDSPKEKWILTRPDSIYHGPKALKEQRLHTNNQDQFVTMDGRDKVQKLNLKEITYLCPFELSSFHGS